MIRFKITTCPSAAQIREYTHDENRIVFGLADGDMIIDDPSFGNRQAQIFFEKSDAKLESLSPQCMVQINGQKIAPGKPHPVKAKDILLIGQTTIVLIDLQERSQELPPVPWENTAVKSRMEPHSNEYAILTVLGQLAKNGLKAKEKTRSDFIAKPPQKTAP